LTNLANYFSSPNLFVGFFSSVGKIELGNVLREKEINFCKACGLWLCAAKFNV
jgi:hypothetical protein